MVLRFLSFRGFTGVTVSMVLWSHGCSVRKFFYCHILEIRHCTDTIFALFFELCTILLIIIFGLLPSRFQWVGAVGKDITGPFGLISSVPCSLWLFHCFIIHNNNNNNNSFHNLQHFALQKTTSS